jgi:Na+/melibiose symporter-like transporter
VGSIGTGIYLTVPSVLLLYYLTQVLSVSPGLAGIAVFVPRVWDVVSDPIMGRVSDRTRTRLGRRRPYLLAGALLTASTFVFLFNTPSLSTETGRFLYVLVVYVLSATAYTVFAVPYLAMPAEMSRETDERTRIMAYRMMFAMTGVLAGSAAAPALLAAFGGGRAGFSAMSFILGGLCAFTMLVAFFGTARAPVVDVPECATGQRSRLLDALREPPFRKLALAYLLQLAGLGTFTGAAPYFVVQVLARQESAISVVFMALLAGTILSMLAWAAVGRWMGKTRAYFIAVVVTLAGLCGLWLPRDASGWTLVPIVTAVIGVGFGGLQLLPFAMLTDIIHDARLRGHDSAGAFTGVWTAVEKCGLAIGPLLVGMFLSIGGFVSGAESQSVSAQVWIRLALSVGPAILVLLSVPAVLSYRDPAK